MQFNILTILHVSLYSTGLILDFKRDTYSVFNATFLKIDPYSEFNSILHVNCIFPSLISCFKFFGLDHFLGQFLLISGMNFGICFCLVRMVDEVQSSAVARFALITIGAVDSYSLMD
jgi:hypothetical protein